MLGLWKGISDNCKLMESKFEVRAKNRTKEEMAAKFIKDNPDHPYSLQFVNQDKKGQMRLLGSMIQEEKKLKFLERQLLISHEAWVEKQSAKQIARDERIRRAYDLLKIGTLEEAGKVMGITRERVRQILYDGHKRGIIPLYKRHYNTREKRVVTCKCGKVFETTHLTQKRCGRECPAIRRRTPEETKAHARMRYQTDPEYRQAHADAMKRYPDRIRNTPEYKERNRKGWEKWHDRHLRNAIATLKESMKKQ